MVIRRSRRRRTTFFDTPRIKRTIKWTSSWFTISYSISQLFGAHFKTLGDTYIQQRNFNGNTYDCRTQFAIEYAIFSRLERYNLNTDECPNFWISCLVPIDGIPTFYSRITSYEYPWPTQHMHSRLFSSFSLSIACDVVIDTNEIRIRYHCWWWW